MAVGWSRLEVEATVASYFAMLASELRRESYNKTEYRRALQPLLNKRTEPAIELKHQNISAVLLQLGFAYIPGYKPRHNFQHLLAEVVAEHLAADQDLVALMRDQVDQPAPQASFDDVLRALVDPPGPAELPRRGTARDRAPVTRHGFDFLGREARNQSLGSAGEEFVVCFETARLAAAGQDRLASQVERVSRTRGDGLGYDILSFDESGRERLIEVKTTRYGRETPFYVTRNELLVSREEGPRYWLYRAFSFSSNARLYLKQGPLDEGFDLEPTEFRARAG